MVESYPVRSTDGAQSSFEGLWCRDGVLVIAREEDPQPKVKACAFTRHDSVEGLRITQAGKGDVQLAKRITFDRHRFDGALDLPGLGKLVDHRPETQQVAAKKFPSGLLSG